MAGGWWLDEWQEVSCIPTAEYLEDNLSTTPWITATAVTAVMALLALVLWRHNTQFAVADRLLKRVERARDKAQKATQTKAEFLAFLVSCLPREVGGGRGGGGEGWARGLPAAN